jgi:hypothetical protein
MTSSLGPVGLALRPRKPVVTFVSVWTLIRSPARPSERTFQRTARQGRRDAAERKWRRTSLLPPPKNSDFDWPRLLQQNLPKADISVGSQKPSKEDIPERSWRIRAVPNALSRCRACASDSAHPFKSASGKPRRAA